MRPIIGQIELAPHKPGSSTDLRLVNTNPKALDFNLPDIQDAGDLREDFDGGRIPTSLVATDHLTTDMASLGELSLRKSSGLPCLSDLGAEFLLPSHVNQSCLNAKRRRGKVTKFCVDGANHVNYDFYLTVSKDN
jgi:hypothetical protein